MNVLGAALFTVVEEPFTMYGQSGCFANDADAQIQHTAAVKAGVSVSWTLVTDHMLMELLDRAGNSLISFGMVCRSTLCQLLSFVVDLLMLLLVLAVCFSDPVSISHI
jgi:hypothetical protein